MSSKLKSAWGLFGCCLGPYLLSLYPAGNLQAFAIFPPNHQIITEQALGDCCFEYTLPNGAKVSFSTEAMTSVMAGNSNMDILSLKDEQLAEDFHFDDERFDFGQFVLLFTRDLIVVQLQDEAFAQSDPQSLLRQQMLTRTSREMLGNALHTLQDYYAHTNWVERSLQNGINLPINAVLGAKGKSLHGPSAQTCDENAPGSTQLTSGYYLASGVFDCANICSAPATECAHGNIACPGVDCGINKDVSPRDHYAEAFDLATEHTELFAQQIFDEALIGDSALKNRVSIAICEFMGVPNPLSTCVTSHTVTVQKLNNANGQLTLEGLVESSGNTITPAINCGLLCEGTTIAGTTVVLTAKDILNWKFVRWAEGGACAASTDRECSFMVDSNKTARAEFNDEFAFEVAESYIPWDSQYPRLWCEHYEGEYQISGYYASFDRCYSNMSAVIRCVGSGCSSSRFKVAISKSILSGTVVGRGAECNSYQNPYGIVPGEVQIYTDSPGWIVLGQGWTHAWLSFTKISPIAASFIFQNFRWIGPDPGLACSGDTTATLELEFNVYDLTTGTYTLIPFVMNVP